MSFNYGIYKGKTYLAKAKGNADAVAIAIALGRGTSIKYCDRIAWKYPDVLEKLGPIDVYTQVNVLNAKINQNYWDAKDKTEARRVDYEKKKAEKKERASEFSWIKTREESFQNLERRTKL